MNVFNIDKSGEDFHLICDPRVTLLFIIMSEEAKYKFCDMRKIFVGTTQVDNPLGWFRAWPNQLGFHQVLLVCVMLAECANVGDWQRERERERQAALDMAHVKDGSSFAARLSKIFIFGEDDRPWISVPKRMSNHPTITEGRQRLLSSQSNGWNDFQIREMGSSLQLIKDILAWGRKQNIILRDLPPRERALTIFS